MSTAIRLGAVSLRIRDLDKTLSFYIQEMGLKVLRKSNSDVGETVELGSDADAEPLVILKHDPKATKPPENAAGLYHFAILLPDRRSLAAAYLSLGNTGVTFDGFSDHLVSEALYLTDPENNGIEIYADRPRDQWKYSETGQLKMDTLPLDIDSLLSDLSGTDRKEAQAIPAGTKIGHVHLKVTGIKRSVEFYHRIVGFDLMNSWGTAAFLSAGGYHHHLGMNTWESLGGPGWTDGWAGLDHFTISIPDKNFIHELSSRLSGMSASSVQSLNGLLISDPDNIKFLIRT